MNVGDLQRWLAGIRPSPARVCAVRDGKEEALSIKRGPNMWSRVAKTCDALKADGVRCYDKDGGLIDQCSFDVDGDEEPMATVTPDVLASVEGRTFTAAEVAAILAQAQVRTVEVTAREVTRVVERTMQASTSMNAVAFTQLSEVTKTLVQHVNELREVVAENMSQERERLEEKREEEKSDARIEGVMMKLIERAGPDGVKGIMGMLNGGGGGGGDHGGQKQ